MNEFPKSEVIMHYASPYYDPVKAHEYYEEHKQLKGRHSTIGLNEKGRAAAQYIRQNLAEERKTKTERSRQNMKGRISASSAHTKTKKQIARESVKSAISSHKEAMNSQINSLRESLKNLSSEDKKGNKGESIMNFEESFKKVVDNSEYINELNKVYKEKMEENKIL